MSNTTPQINSAPAASRAVAAYRPITLLLRDNNGEPTREVRVRKLKASDAHSAIERFGGTLLELRNGIKGALPKIPALVPWLVRECTGLSETEYHNLDIDEAALVLNTILELNFEPSEVVDFFGFIMRAVVSAFNAYASTQQPSNASIE